MNYIKNLRIFLTSSQKKQFFVLVALMFIATILEISLLKFIFEFLNIISEKNYQSNSSTGNLFKYFKINENKVKLIILLIFTIYLIKTSINLFLNWKKGSFIFKLKEELSFKFLRGYLFMPRIFHLRSNTAELTKNITSEIDSFMIAVLSISNILLETMILIGIISFLLFLNFKITLICVILFLIFSLIISQYNSKRSIFLGAERVKIMERRMKNIIESLSGSKTYEMSGMRESIVNVFDKNNKELSINSIEIFFRNNAPKPLFELFTALVITLLLLIFYGENSKLTSIAPTVVVFFAAAYRLIPSFSTIISSLQKYQYNIQSMNNLLVDSLKFEKKIETNKSKLNLNKKINLEKIYFSYETNTRDRIKNYIFEDLNLVIDKGEKIGIVGSSGSGKSTLLDIIMGLLNPTKGKVTVDNKEINSQKSGWQTNIGCVPQDVFILDDTLKKNIAFGIEDNFINEKRINELIDQSNLRSLVNNLDSGIETNIGERGERISGGQKQRVGIARALYSDPEILIFDEPTSALDEQTEKKIVKEIFISNKEKTIIFVTHNKKNLTECNKVYKIDNKKLFKL